MAEGRKVLVESFSNPGISYEVDLDRQSCTCPAFRKRPSQACKHIRSFDGLFFDPPVPDPNEALSAFIKSVRLRRTDDAVLWLLYLWRIPQYRSRVQRRILVAATEDNLSAGVIECTSDWYNALERARPEAAFTEVARICATRNWWAQPEGRAYINAWFSVESRVPGLEARSEEELLRIVKESANGGDLAKSLTAFSALYARTRVAPYRIAELLNDLVVGSASPQARKLVRTYNANLRPLGVDANLSGQALYACVFGGFGDQAVPEVRKGEARDLMAKARENLARQPRIPTWALDGVHTGRFRDGRFAGTTRMMAACCRAYERFGRLSVDDPWPPFLRDPR